MSQKGEGSFQARKGGILFVMFIPRQEGLAICSPASVESVERSHSRKMQSKRGRESFNIVLSLPFSFPLSLSSLPCRIRGHDLRKLKHMQRPHVGVSAPQPQERSQPTASINYYTWEMDRYSDDSSSQPSAFLAETLDIVE